MTSTVVELSDRVVAVVNAARAARADENVVAELEEALRELNGIKERLSALAEIIPEIPGAAHVNGRVKQCLEQTAQVQVVATQDAITGARSDQGRALPRALRELVSELGQATAAAWNDFRGTLRADVRPDFLQKLASLPGFEGARRLLIDNYALQEVSNSSQLPDRESLLRAKTAHANITAGLQDLQARLPPEVRRPLDKCFRGELRLVDVEPDFIDWIKAHDLEDAFVIEAS